MKTKTIKARVKEIINGDVSLDIDADSVEKLVYLAYWMGKETGVQEMSKMVKDHIKEQHARADSCRYHIMANEIVGPAKYLYHPDHAGDMTNTFGDDETQY